MSVDSLILFRKHNSGRLKKNIFCLTVCGFLMKEGEVICILFPAI